MSRAWKVLALALAVALVLLGAYVVSKGGLP